MKTAAKQADAAVDKLDQNKDKVQAGITKGADAATKAGVKVDGQGMCGCTQAHTYVTTLTTMCTTTAVNKQVSAGLDAAKKGTASLGL